MATMAGMSPRLIGEIERGRGTVGFEKVLLVANGLGIDLFTRARGAVEVQRGSKSSGIKRTVEIDLPAESPQVFRDR
ncbi:MAG: helix-turn-helix transcriptional regulator [Olsenella sp.]|nr:helix-turn-helix transcriptional regulator [Olsenella sp.]